MTRTGKIGRLEKSLREQLGQRIEDGIPGNEIVQWLNEQPKTQAVMQQYFHGQTITEQNLSDWKQGGHLDWVRQQEARELVAGFMANAEAMGGAWTEEHLLKHFTGMVGTEITRLALALLAAETDPEKKWQRLCAVRRELSSLHRDAERSARTRHTEHKTWLSKQEAERRGISSDRVEKERRRNMLDEREDLRKFYGSRAEEAEQEGCAKCEEAYDTGFTDGYDEGHEAARPGSIPKGMGRQNEKDKIQTEEGVEDDALGEIGEVTRDAGGGDVQRDAGWNEQDARATKSAEKTQESRLIVPNPAVKAARECKTHKGGGIHNEKGDVQKGESVKDTALGEISEVTLEAAGQDARLAETGMPSGLQKILETWRNLG